MLFAGAHFCVNDPSVKIWTLLRPLSLTKSLIIATIESSAAGGVHTVGVLCSKLLERANYKRRRNKKKKLADKVATDNLAGKERTSEQAKLAYHIAK